MAHINRKYIDKHWSVSLIRGLMATVFGFFMLPNTIQDMNIVMVIVSIFLLAMGIIDSVSALYASAKKRGWANSVIDALIDVVAAVALLFFAQSSIVLSLVIIAIYTFISGIIDILHGFLSTIDPTDRFIKIMVGIFGCVLGFIILNSGSFDASIFVRFFGAYILLVGATSMIYGIHNRAQKIEDKIARKEARKKSTNPKSAKKSKR